MMRTTCLLLVLFATARCGGSSAESTGTSTSSASVSSGTRPCLSDPKDGRTRECFFLGADGQCKSFGTICRLKGGIGGGPCMRDATDGRYKHCKNLMPMGGCALFGTFCAPADVDRRSTRGVPCLQDEQGALRECLTLAAGVCSQFGLVCQ